MHAQTIVHSHIGVTDTLARLYLFLAQSLDRCVSEAARISYPETEFQSNLASTRATVLDMLSVNQVVKGKIEQECNRVGSLVTACLTDGAAKAGALEELKAERARSASLEEDVFWYRSIAQRALAELHAVEDDRPVPREVHVLQPEVAVPVADAPLFQQKVIEHLYFTRNVLAERGKALRLTYNVFIVGITLAVAVFVVVLSRR